MRHTIITPALVVAMAATNISTAFADPYFSGSQSIQDLRPQNELATMAYFKFSLGGKNQPVRERFQSGLRLQMRNVMNAQGRQRTGFSSFNGDINLLDLSMGAKGWSSLQLNGVPLQNTAYSLNAGEDGKKRNIRSGLLIASGVILAIGVAAAAAAGSSNDKNDGNDTHTNDNHDDSKP